MGLFLFVFAGVFYVFAYAFPFPWTKSMGLNSFNHPGPKIRESYGGSAPKPPGKIKRFKPSLLPAFRKQQGGKKKGEEWGLFAPKPLTRNNVPGPYQFGRNACSTRRNLGSYEEKKESMGAVRPQPPNQDVGWSQWRDGSAVSFLQAANVALVRLT